jgi:cell wall-associated NlpC family hydrolase
MARRPGTRRASALLLAAVLGGGLALGTAAPASADPTPAPTSSAAASNPSDTHASIAAEIRRIGSDVVALQRDAAVKSKVAQKADERYLQAEAASQQAALAARDAQTAANAAQAKAAASRARAAAVAAGLARTDMGTLPLNLMLNSRSAGGTLAGLSSASRLSVQSVQVYAQAATDAAAARDAHAASDDAARAAAQESAHAKKTYKTAKRKADAIAKNVRELQAQEQTLIARLADLKGEGVGNACASVGDGSACGSVLPVLGGTAKTTGGKVVAFARAQIGEPYVFAAAGPSAWDCSGLTMMAYDAVGIAIGGHSATAQYNTAKARGELVPMSSAKPGDLLFYTDGGGDMYHVVIYSGHGMMLEAPHEGADVREVPIRSLDLVSQAAHFS